jgi:predicted SprT family Zn-dependent metalloprotease
MTLTEIYAYAVECIERYGLTVYPEFRLKTWRGKRMGQAWYKDNVIEISTYHNTHHSQASVKDTIRHELAHLQAYLEGSRGHDIHFKKWAKLMKCKPTNFKYTRRPPRKRYHFYCCGIDYWSVNHGIWGHCKTCGKLITL